MRSRVADSLLTLAASLALCGGSRRGDESVLHVGRFKMRKDAKGDGFALQQLLVNFIVEKQKFRKKDKEKGGEKK